ncbi:MAG: Hpt domain-containing protein, partial [Bacteroidota bacterium]
MNGPVIKLEELSQLLGDNPTRAKQFVDLFLEETPRRLEEIQNLCVASDWEAFSIAVHELKTQLAYLGIEEGVAWAQRLEDACDQRPSIDELLEEWLSFK